MAYNPRVEINTKLVKEKDKKIAQLEINGGALKIEINKVTVNEEGRKHCY